MHQVRGLITASDVREFWPDINKEVPGGDKIVNIYILRAEILLNRVGQFNQSKENFVADMEVAMKLLVRRLVQMDNHPASWGDAAGTFSESAKGVSFQRRGTRTVKQLIGEEIMGIIAGLLDDEISFTLLNTEVVFDRSKLEITVDGNTIRLFDGPLDDSIESPLSEFIRLPRSV